MLGVPKYTVNSGTPVPTLRHLALASGRTSALTLFTRPFGWTNPSAPPCRILGATLWGRGRRWSSRSPRGKVRVEPPGELFGATPLEGMVAGAPPRWKMEEKWVVKFKRYWHNALGRRQADEGDDCGEGLRAARAKSMSMLAYHVRTDDFLTPNWMLMRSKQRLMTSVVHFVSS
jgi:hypothetical protein